MDILIKENEIFNKGFTRICGIDEAGRGPLAGPVVAACVVIDPEYKIDNEKLLLLNDSKKLTQKRREEFYELIIESDMEIGIGICDHNTIDRINILEATFLAMKKAMGSIRVKPGYILLDGRFKIPNISIKQEAIIKGDEQVFLIAAASIIAKVERDAIMKSFHEDYPEYCFDQHKGYGTKLHFEKLNEHGPSKIHRKSFKGVNRI